MCGILGSINVNFSAKELNLIEHRGPDGDGIEIFNLSTGQVTFGHKRLAIQDLSEAGKQPMLSHCQKFAIIFNGEVYNHFELREKLTELEFNGTSDTETIINYIAKFGIESVKDFNGIFGLAVLDLELEKLHIVRDRFGVKPIYMSKTDKGCVFSSELKAVKALTNSTVSGDKLAQFLQSRYNPSPHTIYAEISKIKPGEITTVNISDLSVSETSFHEEIIKFTDVSIEDATNEYERLFEQAVRRQLLSDVEIGIFLSGGVDSALVAHYAQKYSDKPLKSYTIGFKNHETCELDDARESSEILGTEHKEIIMSREDFQQSLFETMKIVEEPIGTTSIVLFQHLCKEAKKDTTVILTGQGADEPLGGYTRYKAEYLISKLPFLPYLVRLIKPSARFFKNEKLSRGISALSNPDIFKRFKATSAMFSDKEIKNITEREESFMINAYKDLYNNMNLAGLSSIEARMALDTRMNLSDDLLLYTDKISMKHHLETRVPILDNDLIKFIESLPYKYRLDFKTGKKIHKLMADRVLPAQIVHRKKKGFQVPTEKWFKEDMKADISDFFQIHEKAHLSKMFNTSYVKSLVDKMLESGKNYEKQLFMLMSAYTILDEHHKTALV